MVITDRKVAPRIVDAVEFKLDLRKYEKYTLANGVPVYAINAGAEDVLMLDIVFFAGNSYEEKNIIAATTNYLIKNGTSTKNAFQINEHFEYYGSFLNRACYNETATITLHSLSKHLGELLPVVQEIMSDPIFPEEELSVYKQNMKQRLSVNLKKSDFVAGRLIDAFVYGDKHPYGKYTSHAEYDAITRDELIQFYNKWYKEGECIIFVAGKLPSGLEAILNKYLGSLKLKPGDVSNFPKHRLEPKGIKGKAERVSNDELGVQGSIRLAREFPNRHHPDFRKVMVLNTIFGGYFGSRLMKNIREDKGYTYGIHSYLQNHIQNSAWLVSTESGKEVCEDAIKEVYKEMRRLNEELVSEEELLLVRNYMIGSILGDLDGPFQILARWKNLILNGVDEEYFYGSIDTIKSISAKELQALAQKYLRPEEFYELVVV